MNVHSFILAAAALLPAVVLCIYVFSKDRVEKEPIGLLLLLLVLGAATCFPAAEIEEIVITAIDKFFMPYTVNVGGVNFLYGDTFKLYNACKYFIGVALVEEGLKWAVLLLVTKNNKNLNSLFDGLIYAIFVSLGFAALENVMYVFRLGLSNAALRAVTAVPGHMFDAVFMGYYYSMWQMHRRARVVEGKLKNMHLINQNAPEFPVAKFLVLSLLVPVLAHGAYDYCCTVGTTGAMIAFIALLIFLYFYCFGKIRKMSKQDMGASVYAAFLLVKKYPHLIEQIKYLCGIGTPVADTVNTNTDTNI
ncbi:MAG: PrsW family intramembrane metalloprotease [Clostridia bacterium]|nr:PrsW family intramembrane metalloprotease [Clostridia bacterium]